MLQSAQFFSLDLRVIWIQFPRCFKVADSMTPHLLRLFKKFLVGFLGAVLIGLGISQFSASNADVTFYYAVTDLGTLGSDPFTYPSAINDTGQVVGVTRTTSGHFPGPPRSGNHAFLWQNGTMTDLNSLGGTYNSVSGINKLGQVVGFSQTSQGTEHAFLWQNGTMTDLGSLVGENASSRAYGINDLGQVVGYSYPASSTNLGGSEALLWQNGTMTNLGNLIGSYSKAHRINNAGQIAGVLSNTSGSFTYDGFLLQNGSLTNLSNIYPYDMNNQGQIVGDIGIGIGVGHDERAGLWQNGTITDLGTLGGSYSYAWGINDAETVVGEAATSGADHAFVYKNSQMSDLNNFLPANSGWELLGAMDINDNGQIVAIGLFNGQKRGVLLTPITVVN